MKIQAWFQMHQPAVTATAGALIALGFAAGWTGYAPIGTGLLAIASVIAAIPIIIHAWQALRVGVISIELLVTIAVVGAFAIGEFSESAIVTFLFGFGNWLEQKTLSKTRASIKSLTEMAPTIATVVAADGTTETVDVDDVDEDAIVRVVPGIAVPVDGIITTGDGYVDESAITGESRPVHKSVGDALSSGVLLTDGALDVRATRVGDDTTFAKIIELVEEAQDTKSPAERFIDRFAKFYTPAVLVIAFLVWAVTQNIRLAITVLVLGCPGALVIGAPVSNVAGIGNGAKRGILVKGGTAMDTFAGVDTFVFDKTGTLTQGNTAVTQLTTFGWDEATVTAWTAAVEQKSAHPLGRAVLDYAAEREVAFADLPVHDHTTIKGQGVTAAVADHRVLAGNAALLEANGVALTEVQATTLREIQAAGQSVILVAVDGQLAAIYGIADAIRPGVAEDLVALRRAGARHLVMLTGDNATTAQAVANAVGIDEVHAELMPEAKVDFVKQFQDGHQRVAFVGDGINDSPALATADIGIAMGSGTDVAIETSDVVLMQSSFEALSHAYRLAKATVRNTRENIVIAIATVAFLLVGLIFGVVNMASGMFVHEGSILVVILNAMRLIQFGRRRSAATATRDAAEQMTPN